MTKAELRQLYFGAEPASQRFRLALFVFDLLTILYFILSTSFGKAENLQPLDYVLAAILTLEFLARLWIAERRAKMLFSLSSVADILVIASLLASLFIENLGFLRVVRILRLLRSYHLLATLRQDYVWFSKHEQVILSAVNLVIFVFLVTAVVYVIGARNNPEIDTYLDALYFTVSTLTTTGFGDITLKDTFGRMIVVVVMVVGVGLFLRLIQTIFRPTKVAYECPECGLSRHDPDSVHCKHCGHVLNIPTEGEWI